MRYINLHFTYLLTDIFAVRSCYWSHCSEAWGKHDRSNHWRTAYCESIHYLP